MKENKKLLSTIAVFAILLVLFVVVVTVIPFTKIASSWTAFSFGIVSIVASCVITVYSFKKGDSVVSKIYGFSLFKLGIAYLALQMAVSVVLLILGAFLNVPVWVAAVLGVLVLGFCAIGLIVVDNAIDIVEEQEEKVEARIKEIKTFNVNVGTIIAICQNNEFLPHLERLAEAFKYSDPVSSEQTEPLENNLRNEINILTTLVATNSENTVSKIKEIEALLSSRNAVCKLSK
ncbi:MAG: hypothetical protein J6B45_02040 [Clostridia bacterium]|nr:hypothetical protein [Clostridia bacterium]